MFEEEQEEGEEEQVYCGTAIGTVGSGSPSWEFLMSILNAKYLTNAFKLALTEDRGTYEAQNELVQWFLYGSGCFTLLLLASDVILPPGGITRLACWGQPVVSALVPHRIPPYAPMLYREHLNHDNAWRHKVEGIEGSEWKEKLWDLYHKRSNAALNKCNIGLSPRYLSEPFVDLSDNDPLWEVEEGSTHCLLVERDVFDAIESPWFGEEKTFYTKAIEAGFKCYMDTSTIVGHEIRHAAALLDGAVWSISQGGNRNA